MTPVSCRNELVFDGLQRRRTEIETMSGIRTKMHSSRVDKTEELFLRRIGLKERCVVRNSEHNQKDRD